MLSPVCMEGRGWSGALIVLGIGIASMSCVIN
ncbi:unnamed protein product, partial [marine sediment metagenome]